MSLKNILGENVPDLNLKIAVLVDQLECAGALCDEHVPKIVSICETCTEPRFLQWICGVHANATPHEQKLCVHQALVLKLPTAFAFVQLVIESTNKKFTTMSDGGHWSPATTSKAVEGPIPLLDFKLQLTSKLTRR